MSTDVRVLEEAARWFSILGSGEVSEADRLAWRRWLDEPAHALAWQRVERISGRFERLALDPAAREAGARLHDGQASRRQALKVLTLLVGGGALGLGGGGALPWREWSASLRSGVGEVRDLRLADGSHLWLNTDTAADFDVATRHLRLHRGEVLVDAAAGSPPFRLESAQGWVRPQAQARVAVRQRSGRTQLGVFSGAVQVMPFEAISGTWLRAGEQARFDSVAVSASEPLQRARQAWVDGVLLADSLRLGDFIDELSRYRRGYLACDPRVADLPVVGAFPLGDTERILSALASTLPVRVHRRTSWWVTLEPGPGLHQG